MPGRRFVIWIVVLLALGYAGLCAVVALMQDPMVFPGAGRGDRGVPPTSPPATLAWIGPPERRTRVATIAPERPTAVALYLGGNGEDLYSAVLSAASLVRHGWIGIAAEYPGYGGSPGRPSVAGLLATASDAAAFARERAAAAGLPLVVVGSSLGSFGAVHVAAAGGADLLVLRAPPTSLVAVAKRQFWWLPVGWLLHHRFDNLGVAGQVRCPVLVVHGEADTIVPPAFGRELAAAVPGARFVPVPGRGHNDLDLDPDGPVGAVLRAFVAGG